MMNGDTTNLVFSYISRFIQQNGHAPSQREIARDCYLAQSSVRYHLAKLKAAGRISYDPGKARNLTITRH